MRYYWKTMVVAFCLAFAGSIATVDTETCIPENDLYIPTTAKNISMNEATFHHVIDVVEDLYTPIVKEFGGNLLIERKWEDGTVNAYAQRIGNTYKVSMFGGLARHATVTPDGFALVVCHEIGHHIGGAPKKKSWFGTAWASNEGQSDYWGTTKCLKRVFKVLEDFEVNQEDPDYKHALVECEKRFESEEGRYICLRSSMAGKSLANLFRALRNLEKELHFYTPDASVVARTNDSHPAPQCRMDTYFSASLCEKSVDETVSDTDEAKGVCYRKEGYELRARPFCWFKPKE